jgi:hypothetical protein
MRWRNCGGRRFECQTTIANRARGAHLPIDGGSGGWPEAAQASQPAFRSFRRSAPGQPVIPDIAAENPEVLDELLGAVFVDLDWANSREGDTVFDRRGAKGLFANSQFKGSTPVTRAHGALSKE